MSYTRPDNTVSIQALAKACGVSRSTILRMENEGLLNPAYTDPDSGYRYYSTGNLAQVVRILNYQSLGFTKKEISEFLTDPDILRKNIDRLNEKYNTILRELDRLTVMTRTDESYIIRLQEVKGGPYLRFSKTMVYNPLNVYLYTRECLERFMAMKLTGLTGHPMHIFPEGNPIGFFDDKVHDCNLLIPVKEESYPGQEIITIEPSLALILSCNCNIFDCERYFHALWEEAEKLGYKPESHVRIVAFPEIVSYSRTDDHIHPMMLGMHVS
ncbi:MAG: MerR family transcriptional regulator [Lachnospiraceae bacterium]|nr:MerR family transcriptional regulator [Lachnospiraceae bacterium]